MSACQIPGADSPSAPGSVVQAPVSWVVALQSAFHFAAPR